MVETFLGGSMNSQMLKNNEKCIFLVSHQKLVTKKNVKIIVLLVKYVLNTYRLLFGGP